MPGNAGASYNYATFFNPTGSGKVAIVKQTALRVNAIAAASYSPIQIKRISAASGGTQITAANIPKKDSAAANSAVEIRRTGVTATYSQGVDGQLLAIQTPGTTAAAASLAQNGWRELSFENDEEIVLQPGEGIVLNNNAAADADHRIYWYLEWEEVLTASTPVAEESHLITIGPVNGSLTDDYVYATLYNPPTSNHRYIVSRVGIRSDRNGTAVAPTYIPMTVRKITAASGGTLITTADIPEQNNNSTSSTAEIRKDGVSTTFDMAISSRILNVVAPGVVRQSVGVLESSIVSGDEIVLQPGEGLGLYQESAAGDVLIRHSMTLMWREVEIPTPPYISFSISDNSVGFGNLSSVSARYASGDGLGTGTIYTTAHSISVTSNAVGGYVMTLGGNTLTSGPNTISAIGPTALSPAVGSNQFGVAASVLSGSGNVSSPYSTTNFYALDSAAFPDVIATGAGDEVETIYNLSYVANIAALTSAGNYSATLNYVVTGTF
jgi:hypothetical protein